MEEMKVIVGKLEAKGLRFALVASRFNSFVVERLVDGAVDAFVRHGGSETDLVLVKVPGSYEIPLVCKRLAESRKYDAVIALGAVIRGATGHYDLVANEVARGVAEASFQSGVPVIFGVLTTDNLEQAIERAGSKAGNKGSESALAAIEMANVLKAVGKPKP